MAGLIFLKTGDLDEIRKFYIDKIGMELWHDQGKCIILRHENFLLGFCKGEIEGVSPCITFFYKTKEEVNTMYSLLRDIATSDPVFNKEFNIYHFWAQDVEGRTLEFQHFCDSSLRI
jgi:catechol 2,3-dioxygenase-like lactoylglutathione lyase family enzyme